MKSSVRWERLRPLARLGVIQLPFEDAVVNHLVTGHARLGGDLVVGEVAIVEQVLHRPSGLHPGPG